MSTGYTAILAKEPSFKDFVLRCSRVFGANIHLRDNKLSSEVIYQEINKHYSTDVKEAEEEYEKYINKTLEEKIQKFKENYKKGLCRYEEQIRKRIKLRNIYKRYIDKVRKW